MKFCGSCGVDVENGKKITLDAWNEYFNYASVATAEFIKWKLRSLNMTAVLIILIVVIWVGALPFQNLQTLLLWYLIPIFTLLMGGAYLYGLQDEIKAIGKHLGGFEDARLAILTGKLTTSKEIIAHLEDLVKGLKPSFKDVRNVARQILDELPQ